jgi:hypothetical protein
MDWLCALSVPRRGHQRSKACCVIVMMVRDKNDSDISDLNTRLCDTACDPVSSIDDIMCAVDS